MYGGVLLVLSSTTFDLSEMDEKGVQFVLSCWDLDSEFVFNLLQNTPSVFVVVLYQICTKITTKV